MAGKIVIIEVAAYWGERKGLGDFIRLANDPPDEYQIIMVGVTPEVKEQLPERILAIERTNSQVELRELYGAADAFVNPTIQDNYPTVNLESAACGTPVITYDTGGSPENAYTPTCVIPQKNYEALKACIISSRFVNALRVEPVSLLGKEVMTKRYEELYLEKGLI